eukprot:1161279-Pelagomonas_calceolata.AAC.2
MPFNGWHHVLIDTMNHSGTVPNADCRSQMSIKGWHHVLIDTMNHSGTVPDADCQIPNVYKGLAPCVIRTHWIAPAQCCISGGEPLCVMQDHNASPCQTVHRVCVCVYHSIMQDRNASRCQSVHCVCVCTTVSCKTAMHHCVRLFIVCVYRSIMQDHYASRCQTVHCVYRSIMQDHNASPCQTVHSFMCVYHGIRQEHRHKDLLKHMEMRSRLADVLEANGLSDMWHVTHAQ